MKSDNSIQDTNQPPVKLPKGCKLLAEAGSFVLAEQSVNVNGHSSKHYITWRKQYDGSVGLGHYWNEDLQAAKEDFVRRSDLVDEALLFSYDEMAVVYKALMEYDRSGTIDYNNKELLKHIENIRDKLSEIPDVDKYARIQVLILEPQKAPYEARIYCESYSFCAEVGGNSQVSFPFKDSAVIFSNAQGQKSGLQYNRTIDEEPYYATSSLPA